MIERTTDVILGHKDLELLLTLKNFPVFCGCTDAPKSDDLLADMFWSISHSSGCVQLNSCVPLNILYASSHGSGSIGKTWLEHHQAFASLIKKYNSSEVLEIGGGDGVLSREYHKLCPETKWTIVEPSPFPLEGVKARYIQTFMDENFIPDKNYNIIVHSHVLEHIYYPIKFLEHISSFTQDGAIQIFSVPKLDVWLRRFYLSSLNFEHTYLLTDDYIMYMFSKFGWKLIEKLEYGDSHSVFYVWRKCIKKRHTYDFSGLYENNKNNFLRYYNYYLTKVNMLNNKMSYCERPIYIFGGHPMSQFLLGLGLHEEKIVSILDNDPNKFGKRLYGSKLYVKSPKTLKTDKYPILILNAGSYQQEIKNDIIENINPQTEFWE